MVCISSKVIRDPLHNLIILSSNDECGVPAIHNLIDTREFQRLRRIRQLEVSWFTYPGAEHSRFVHSLGTYHLAFRIISELKRSADSLLVEDLEQHTRYILAAALLHDVGHGPFSHVIESVFSGKNHEEWDC